MGRPKLYTDEEIKDRRREARRLKRRTLEGKVVRRKERNKWSKKRRSANDQRLREAKASPCLDCGQSYPPRVMHFHHRVPTEKKFSVGLGPSRRTWQACEEEIAKCDLLCANCHALRHCSTEESSD